MIQKIKKQTHWRIIQRAGLVFVCVFMQLSHTEAQITPLATQYYQNQYVGNPALAGMSENLIVNLDYRNQWRAIPGSPVTQSFTADYKIKEKVGVGLNLYNDKAGLIRRTRVMGSYAYHLPLSGEKRSVHFGLSVGALIERLDDGSVIAAPNDLSAARYNERKAYLDGDFGIAYISDKLTLQGALPNLKKFLKKDISNSADGSTYFLSVAYNMGRDNDMVALEPKLCIRGARGFNNLWDLGTAIKFPNNLISLVGMYHSSNSTTLGFELNIENRVFFHGFYSSQLAALGEDTGGSFEIGFQLPLNIIKLTPANQGK
ncbi:PorP/SprF family type IX secretion system membrane protein [Arcticibacter tournemirensis]|uniref:Type IX secretion system membrane protein PorP/SprF n=1 Tax=Arcticibacter tournemirensis TaxID=699437 RepID=A0A4Q0M550_9SPHI|nr:type IX secretion system membrane protein PorP/SprF [Arcticibacter tournemirensis]RXF67859.1 type IX secretion system membrane protein PorP/SprF [Arcticibacter tournemirensis]